MVLLRRYQLDIVFLFFAVAAILWSALTLLKHWGADPHDYEFIVAGPMIVLYVAALWKIRYHIQKQEHRNLTARTLLYWIAFGLLLFASYAAPLPATDYWSLEIIFIIFTVFLADSYWDFRKLTHATMFSRKELGR